MHKYSLVAIHAHKHIHHHLQDTEKCPLNVLNPGTGRDLIIILAMPKLMKVNYKTIRLHFIYLPLQKPKAHRLLSLL